MNIIIDICHPGQVHLFKNLIYELRKRNHRVVVTVKEIPVAVKLLKAYKIDYEHIGSKSDGLIGKALNQIKYNIRVSNIVKKKGTLLGIGSSVTLTYLSKYSRLQSILMDDDDDKIEPIIANFVHPFADQILSPDALVLNRRAKQSIFYPGYHELAYLHPSRFKPDVKVIKKVGICEGDNYFILRFNAFKAHHDIKHRGLDIEQKRSLIEILKTKGRVFISTEREIDAEFKPFSIKLPPEDIHSFMYYSTMFIGDSQTMVSEAALLGIPSIKCNTFAGNLSVPNEIQNKYDLCYSYQPEEFQSMKMKILELLNISDLKNLWKARLNALLNDKIDVTSFMIWFVENWPRSKHEIINTKEFWAQFK